MTADDLRPPASHRTVNCPHCGKPVAWTPDSRFRPFCSERCRMIDLGQWSAEQYRIEDNEQQKPPEEE